MNEETITVTLKEYKQLKEDSDWLQCLEAAGVDNWSGMEYAIQLRRENEEDE